MDTTTFWGKIALLTATGVITTLIVDAVKRRNAAAKEPELPEGAAATVDIPPIVAQVPGYRRARTREVTPAMKADALGVLGHPIGDVVYRDAYALALEHHYDARGRHKGVSVFLPEPMGAPAHA